MKLFFIATPLTYIQSFQEINIKYKIISLSSVLFLIREQLDAKHLHYFTTEERDDNKAVEYDNIALFNTAHTVTERRSGSGQR